MAALTVTTSLGEPPSLVPVSIVIEGEDGKALQKLETTVVSSLDQIVLPDAPLVVGPGYTPNPELAGRPGGDLPPDQVEACPPAA